MSTICDISPITVTGVQNVKNSRLHWRVVRIACLPRKICFHCQGFNCSMSEKIKEKETIKSSVWWLTLLGLAVISMTVRLYMIQVPNVVCWDEFHFVKMSTFYINQKFFFDVHPPLGKILLALIGYLNNYQGDFEYKMVGEAYRIDFPYVELRMFCGILSSFLPVFCFCIVWIGTTSFKASLLAGAFVLFDNSLILIGRLILLDSMLLFFMVSSFLCFAKSQKYEPTSGYQVIWLILTGLCLGFEISTKLVGLFTMSFYILRCICTFWQQLLPNKSHSLLTLARFCGIHILCLAVIPFIIYFLIFMIHLDLLKYSNIGDYLFSAPFQSHLQGNMFNDLSLPKYVSYGSEVVLKNVGGKAYLNHPVQSDCHKLNNLVTSYPIINEEAFWKFRPFLDFEENEVKYISDRDVVQLKHSSSMKLLKRLPPSAIHASQDVICTNEMNEVDENHFYRIQIDLAESPGVSVLDGNNGSKDDQEWNMEDGKMLLKPMKHVFKLVGVDDDCFLQSTEWPIVLPGHKEVSCSLTKFNENNLWYVEWLHDEKAEKVHVDIQPMTIWQRFIETHIIMFKANSDLKAGKDDTISSPWQWFFNIPGQPILGPYYIIYLLGTPITWFMSSAILLTFIISNVIVMMTEHRASSAASSTMRPYMETCFWMTISWSLHYFPFFLMNRPLYFHHYLPAAIFKFMGAGIAIDIFLRRLEFHTHYIIMLSVMALLLSVIFQNFQTFSSLTYGLNSTGKSEEILNNLRWTNKWKF